MLSSWTEGRKSSLHTVASVVQCYWSAETALTASLMQVVSLSYVTYCHPWCPMTAPSGTRSVIAKLTKSSNITVTFSFQTYTPLDYSDSFNTDQTSVHLSNADLLIPTGFLQCYDIVGRVNYLARKN